ncbi:MAG: hypothetical protein KDJ99_08250, partial [Candidatus Competibacteraceae bacterium]|nr:hypothetical protein [Candidatus Competibacteraceae bacterium]
DAQAMAQLQDEIQRRQAAVQRSRQAQEDRVVSLLQQVQSARSSLSSEQQRVASLNNELERRQHAVKNSRQAMSDRVLQLMSGQQQLREVVNSLQAEKGGLLDKLGSLQQELQQKGQVAWQHIVAASAAQAEQEGSASQEHMQVMSEQLQALQANLSGMIQQLQQ